MYLAITDQIRTIKILDSTSPSTCDFELVMNSWFPKVAQKLTNNLLGGSDGYGLVEDIPLTLQIRNTAAATIWDKVHLLEQLLDQAERWALGEEVLPVYIRFLPAGSEFSITNNEFFYAQIYGRAKPSKLPENYLSTLDFQNIQNYQVVLKRAGLWLLDRGKREQTLRNAEVIAAAMTKWDSSVFNDNPAGGGITYTAEIPSPCALRIFNSSALQHDADTPNDYLFIAHHSNFLQLMDLATGGVSTAAVDALGGAYRRFTINAGLFETVTLTIPGTFWARMYDIYATLRIVTPGASFRVTCSDSLGTTSQQILTGVTNPTALKIGSLLYDPSYPRNITITFTNIGTASAIIDVDALAFVTTEIYPMLSGLPQYMRQIKPVHVLSFPWQPWDTALEQRSFLIDNGRLNNHVPASPPALNIRYAARDTPWPKGVHHVSKVAGFPAALTETPIRAMNYFGDAFLQHVGTTMSVIYLGTCKIGGVGYWRHMSQITPSLIVQNEGFTAIRRMAYLVPE